MVGGGSKSAKGGPNPLADMDRGGPNPLADLDRGVQIRCDTGSWPLPPPETRVTFSAFRSSSIYILTDNNSMAS